MATSPIDLSAGLVPKAGGIDLSAGLVPKDAAPAEKSLFQKAKDNFNAATQGAKPGDGALKGAIEDVGAGGGDVIRALAHPLNTINAMTSTPDPDMALVAHVMGDDTALNKVNATTYPTAARTIGQIGTGAILGEAAGRSIGPVAQAARSTVGRAVLRGKTPEGAYESALKPSTTLTQAQRDAAVTTGINNEIPVSKAGVQKLYDLVDDYNQKIAGEINSDPTRPIDPNAVATRADLAKAKFSKQVNAGGDLAAIEASKQQFLSEQGATPGNPAPPMNASDAQAMKQGTYQVLKGKFGEQGSASVEAQKSLARGLKEEIANQFPEISNLNASESRLLDLQPILERAVGRVSNHQLIGIGTPVAGAAAKAVTGSGALGVVTGVLKAVLDNPEMKSKLAIAVSKGAKIPIGEAAARVQSYSAALGSTAAGAQAYSSADNPNSPTTPQQ
jgi:hypothetical protein